MIRFCSVIIFPVLFVLLLNCKPNNQSECPAVEQQEIVLNQAREMRSQAVSCDSEKVSKILRIQYVPMH
ncbi:MAG: hypothetical protein AAB575_03285 [Patescibacteria group bacterium]